MIDVNSFQILRTYNLIIGDIQHLTMNCEENKLFLTHSNIGIVSVFDIRCDGGLVGQDRVIFEDKGGDIFGAVVSIGAHKWNECKLRKDRNFNGAIGEVLNEDMKYEDDEIHYSKWSMILILLMIGMNLSAFCYYKCLAHGALYEDASKMMQRYLRC